MQEGVLPATYLGVPIHSRVLREVEYAPLLQVIRTKVCQWAQRKLSYAGRLQLLSAVLMSVQRYWAQIFNLPKGVIHQIESICRSFLWSGVIMVRSWQLWLGQMSANRRRNEVWALRRF